MLRIVSFGGVIIWLLKGCKTKLEDEKWDHDIRNAIVGFLSIGLLLGIIYLIMSNHQCPKKIFERLIFKNQLELNRLITYIRQLFGTIEQVLDWSLVRQHSACHSQDVECRPVELAVMFHNGYQTVCDNRNMDLYSHRILGIAPEERYPEMLLYPSEEQFHLPSLFVQPGKVIIAFVKDIFRYSCSQVFHSDCKVRKSIQIDTRCFCL